MLRDIFSPSPNTVGQRSTVGGKEAHPSLMFSGNPLASGTIITLIRHSSMPGPCYAEVILTSEAPGQCFCMSIIISVLM